jgi:hypothetical protein
MKKYLRGPLAAAAMTLGILATSTAPATADQVESAASWPSNCTFERFIDRYAGVGTKAICKSGGGQYRAAVICRPVLEGSDVTRLSPVWRNSGSGTYSYVYCPPETVYSSSGIEKRAG